MRMATIFSIGKPRNQASKEEKVGEQAIDYFLEIQERVNDLAVEDRFPNGLGTAALRHKVSEIKKNADALLHTLYILEGIAMK
jgi:hypothetical protein